MKKGKRGLWISLIAMVVIAVVWLGSTLAAGWSPKLGLDLDGGLSVVYKTVKPVSGTDLSTAAQILNDRVTGNGASGATVATQGGNEISVSIPGEKNPQKILNGLGNTAQLFIRPALCFAPAPKAAKGTTLKPAPYPACSTGTQLTSTALAVNTSSGSPTGNIPADSALAQYASTPSGADQKSATVLLPGSSGSGLTGRVLLGPAQLSGTDVHSASAQVDTLGNWGVQLNLTSAGATKWDTLATQQFHAYIAFDLDAQIISMPLTLPKQASFSSFGGTVLISGGFTHAQATQLANQLTYGALPVALQRITVQTVSPTLGKASLQAGMIAGIAGLLVVMLYMLLYYRLLGMVVISGLVLTGALLWSIIALLGQSSGTTLDLAGIIGIIVSIGITVDSYIVYFERLKDETRAGRTVRTSVDRGFASAFRTVLAADAVSFLGAAILYFISIGPVRGFALFLGISTLLDVIVTYFFTRPFVVLLGRHGGATEARRLGVARGLGLEAEGAR
ncbi:MAG: protein translocase subunit SecD [Actinomycetota bacterium]|nr:protein translocase subunit SecD [Actinomycetota bacterium]